MNTPLVTDIAVWEGESGAVREAHTGNAAALSGSEAQVGWACRIRGQVVRSRRASRPGNAGHVHHAPPPIQTIATPPAGATPKDEAQVHVRILRRTLLHTMSSLQVHRAQKCGCPQRFRKSAAMDHPALPVLALWPAPGPASMAGSHRRRGLKGVVRGG